MSSNASSGSTAATALSGTLPPVQYTFNTAQNVSSSWRVRRIELNEQIFAPYECTVDLATSDLDIVPTDLEGDSCVLTIERGSMIKRVCGIIWKVQWRGTIVDAALLRVQFKPALAAMGHTFNSRIFPQEQSIKDTLQQVLTEGLQPYQRTVDLANLTREYKPREYCVQYNESDLAFAMRIMAEEGIYFYFDHSGEEEKLYLVDSNEKCPAYESANGLAVPVISPESPTANLGIETIHNLFSARELQSTGSVMRDFDWTRPKLDLTATDGAADVLGRERNVYEYPAPQVLGDYDKGKFTYTRDEGKEHAELRRQEFETQMQQIAGEGKVSGLMAGQKLEVGGEVMLPLTTQYLITAINHIGEAPEENIHEMDVRENNADRYHNSFTCIPLDVPYRPCARPRPVIHGPQTAKVVGPANEEIFTDEHGRIKVQFHWDRQGQNNENSSCWIRVAQAWAGAGWGFVFLPRIGMEVIVQFLEGNPDRPLVMGCVYNGDHPPPYKLPDKKTISVIKTSSSLGNKGYNEFRFEDAAGSEEVYLQAQKDLNELVKNNHSTTVNANQTLTVNNNRNKTIKKNETNTVEGERTTTITKKETRTFKDDRETTVKGNDKLTIEKKSEVKVTDKLTETFDGGRGTTIKKGDTLTVNESNKTTTVHGEYNITADTQFKVTQGGDSLLIKDSATLTSAGDIKLSNNGCSITAGNDGKLSITANSEVSITCGSASITLKSDGTIDITGQTVTTGSANNNIKFEPAGTTVSGVKITSAAVGIHEIQGALVKIG
ncbi:MAG: type VI secretion system tip protein VgrG [Deltaproteobacteria bacterium]|nr:type VI secretion system tip protein VgrG [Deltaproteobacteria bacterium]